MKSILIVVPCSFAFVVPVDGGEITRFRLSHQTNEPTKLVVNWESSQAGNAVVRFAAGDEPWRTIEVADRTTLHHVEIPLVKRDVVYRYSVQTGDDRSAEATFKAYPTDELRVVTLQNEQNSRMRTRADGKRHDLFRRGTCTITGFSYFAERAEVNDHVYYNTALGVGAKYPDSKAQFFAREASYVLLPLTKQTMKVELKSLDGRVLDRKTF